ncbi:hypothetical protein QAD02_017698 [Eretmocerus hayati]|uniref:Uncharacterized protein n=1 Tax=Eretmocerus hayati TaxID=131215 RepID=A0ACC2PEK8_9HYME|nr:hypothetical protein QAD02_017698 [Eretmocerus hayati]
MVIMTVLDGNGIKLLLLLVILAVSLASSRETSQAHKNYDAIRGDFGRIYQNKNDRVQSIVDEVDEAIVRADPSEVGVTNVGGSNENVYNKAEQRVSVINVAGANSEITNERSDQVSIIKVGGSNPTITNNGAAEISEVKVDGNNVDINYHNIVQMANITVIGNNPSVQAYSCNSHSRLIQISHDRFGNPYMVEVEEWAYGGLLYHTDKMTNYGTSKVTTNAWTRPLNNPYAPKKPFEFQ